MSDDLRDAMLAYVQADVSTPLSVFAMITGEESADMVANVKVGSTPTSIIGKAQIRKFVSRCIDITTPPVLPPAPAAIAPAVSTVVPGNAQPAVAKRTRYPLSGGMGPT